MLKNKLKIIWFWIVAFTTIIYQTFKNNHWHMIYVDLHIGNNDDRPIRKQLIAKQEGQGLKLYWQDLSYYDKEKG